MQHKAVLVAHAEREPHVAELQEHGLCARRPRSHCTSYTRVRMHAHAPAALDKADLGAAVHKLQGVRVVGLFKVVLPRKAGSVDQVSAPCASRPRKALAAKSTHRVKPLPSSRTTIQQPGSSVSSSSNFLTYS